MDIWYIIFINIRQPAQLVHMSMLMMKKTKQKKEYPIEKLSTMTPALKNLLLLYLSILCNKPHRFYLLGHECI